MLARAKAFASRESLRNASEFPSSWRRPPGDSRFVGACLVAIGLHAVLLGFDISDAGDANQGAQEQFLEAPALDFIDVAELTQGEEESVPPEGEAGTTPREPFLPPVEPASVSVTPTAVPLTAEQASDTNTDFSIDGEPEPAAPTESSSSSESGPPPRKRLSLSQLGIGAQPHFDSSAPLSPVPPRRAVQPSPAQRLQQSFTQSAAKEAQKLGLGITSELKGALLRASQSVKMEKEGSAFFVFTFGEGGALVSTKHRTLGGAPGDWARVAELVKASLRKKPARLAPSSKGARLSYAVDYSYRLPSGRKKGSGLKFSPIQEFDVADIGATTQAVTKVVLQNYQVF